MPLLRRWIGGRPASAPALAGGRGEQFNSGVTSCAARPYCTSLRCCRRCCYLVALLKFYIEFFDLPHLRAWMHGPSPFASSPSIEPVESEPSLKPVRLVYVLASVPHSPRIVPSWDREDPIETESFDACTRWTRRRRPSCANDTVRRRRNLIGC